MPGPGGQPSNRSTFRPPWVKDGPPPIPMPTAPWTLNQRRDSKTPPDDTPAFAKIRLKSVPKPADLRDPSASPEPEAPKAVSKITINMSQSKADKSPSPQPPTSLKSRENGSSSRSSSRSPRGRLERNKSKSESPLSKSESTTEAPTLKRSESRANLVVPPPMPPRPPPPPPSREVLKDIPPLTETQKKNLEMLKSRPRKRPDWACMMKEVESGIKLKHVTCNDRSAPIIERAITKVSDPTGDTHYVFDSEKSNVHNKLLKEIQSGVKLKSVKTNDRSKPILEGLRKFRRQLTIEEQLQKAEQAPVDDAIPDEMDDIDAVRDDLQSTKQMLALELRNKEALERENKRLQARVLNLEVELEQEKKQKGSQQTEKQVDQKLAESLKKEVEQARKDVERIEKEFSKVAEERDRARSELEEMKRAYASLEKRMKAGMALAGCPSAKDVARIATQKSVERAAQESTEEEEEESSEEESEEDEDPKVAEEKRNQRELKMMKTKLKNIKHKTTNSKKERQALKEQIKQQQKLLKEEKKKYKTLHKEVEKMAKLMAAGSDEEDDEKDEDDEDEEEEETESEEESSSEESEDEEDSETDNEDLPFEKRKVKLDSRVKKHDNRLSSLKKGNYLLKAQVDRLKDDLVKQREEVATLQEDLDSVLAELG